MAAPSASESGPPRYYAVDESGAVIRIRKTATGAIVATVPQPWAGLSGMRIEGVVTGSSGKYIAVYDQGALAPNATRQTRLYSFRLTSAGQVTGLSPVKGGVLDGVTASGFTSTTAIAISPDGSKVALAVYSTAGQSYGKGSTPEVARIVVVDLRTGTRESWQGGLQRPGYIFSIPSISWAPGGQWLVFLSAWCQVPSEGGYCGPGAHSAQVRTLDLTGGGGTLTQGSSLLTESPDYPFIVQALLTPGGASITAAVLPGSFAWASGQQSRQELRVIQIPLTGGRPVVLYHGRLGDRVGVYLASDPTGRYWLLAGHWNGWIDNGALRLLEPQGGYAMSDAW